MKPSAWDVKYEHFTYESINSNKAKGTFYSELYDMPFGKVKYKTLNVSPLRPRLKSSGT